MQQKKQDNRICRLTQWRSDYNNAHYSPSWRRRFDDYQHSPSKQASRVGNIQNATIRKRLPSFFPSHFTATGNNLTVHIKDQDWKMNPSCSKKERKTLVSSHWLISYFIILSPLLNKNTRNWAMRSRLQHCTVFLSYVLPYVVLYHW